MIPLSTKGKISDLERLLPAFGEQLARAGHNLIVCSPYPDAADRHVVTGVARAVGEGSKAVEFHYVGTKKNLDEIKLLTGSLSPDLIRHPPPDGGGPDAMKFAYLTAQMIAMENCDVIVAIGGKTHGSAKLLLTVAEERREAVLPFAFFGGTAEQTFDRRRHELQHQLGNGISVLSDPDRMVEAVSLLGKVTKPTFFISYSRQKHEEADHVETLLLRQGFRDVIRDEASFPEGDNLNDEICDCICRSDVFIAMWCSEYHKSRHCLRELDIAIKQNEAGELRHLLIFNVDGTEVIMPKACDVLHSPASNRDKRESSIHRLVNRLKSFWSLEELPPALEIAHAEALAMEVAATRSTFDVIVNCLFGRGDKDRPE